MVIAVWFALPYGIAWYGCRVFSYDAHGWFWDGPCLTGIPNHYYRSL
jgi:hypothetical protein